MDFKHNHFPKQQKSTPPEVLVPDEALSALLYCFVGICTATGSVCSPYRDTTESSYFCV